MRKLTPTQRKIAIITVTALLIYSFVNLGLAINSFIKLKNNITYLEDFAKNWQSTTILDLQVTTGACPSGYENAFGDNAWPGTKRGCWCGSVSSSVLDRNNITCSPFCSGSCSSTASRVGCDNVASKAGKTFNYVTQVYDSGSSSRVAAQVCIKRSDESLATNAQYAKKGNCPSGYTACGSGDYLFCTKQASCPIATITPSSTTYNQATKSTCLASNGCYIISDSGSGNVDSIQIAKLGAVNAYPLSQMTLNEYSMCDTEDEANKTPGRYLFYLLNKRPSGCGSEGQSLWNNAFTTNEKVLFDNNGIDITYFNSFRDSSHGLGGGYYPTSETGTSYSYGLYNRGYLPWAPQCRDKLESLVKNINKVSQTKTAQLALLVVSILAATALGIVLSVMELMNLAGKDLPCIAGKEEEERTKIKKIKKIISYVFKGIQIPFQIWAIIICVAVKGFFADISKHNCSNSDVNTIMAYFSKTFQSTYSSNITSITITLLSIVFDIVSARYHKRQENKAKTAPQVVSPTDEKAALQLTPRKDIDHQAPQESAKYPPTIENSSPLGYNNTPQPTIVQPQPQYVQQQFIPQQQQVPPQQYANQQYPPQQYPNQYPPQQFPGQMPPQQFQGQQYPPQQYPNQYPPQQFPPQQMQGQPQQYPPQQFPNQYPPQEFPGQQYPNQYPPQQFPVQQNPITQETQPKDDDYDPKAKFGRGQYY